jgi:TetR/AcrR family transcriptional regulator, cholesterol catabolism regulator
MEQQENTAIDRRARRMSRRQQEIFAVATHMFAEYGYERTTLEMIAQELGLSKPSLYYYVKSKEEVLAHIFQDIFRNILDRIAISVLAEMPPQRQLHELIHAYVIHACHYPEGRILFLYESHLLDICNPELQALRDDYQQRMEDAIVTGMKRGVFHVTHAKLATLALIGALHSIPLWYVPDGPLSPVEIAEYYAGMLIGGLVAPVDLSPQAM